MKIRELIGELLAYDGELDVVIQKDSEGNGYHWAGGIIEGVIPNDTQYYIEEVYDLDWSADDVDMKEDEWETYKKENKKVLILFP